MTTYLLLHGFTGTAASFDELVGLLPSAARVLRPTLAGHGESPPRALSWQAELERLETLLEVEGVQRAHVVGYSMGGRLGWGLAQRSQRVERATLIGAHPGLEDERERARRGQSDARWTQLLEREGIAAFVERWEALPLWRTQLGLEPSRLLRQRAIREAHDPAQLAAALRVLGLARMPPTDPDAVRVPVTLVVGERDDKHVSLAQRFAPRLTQARISVVPDAGHNVLLERPRAVAEALA